MQIRLSGGQRHLHFHHQGAQPIDRMIVKMLLADAAIGDEQALRPKSQPDALGNAGERRGKRRPDSAVEDPERTQLLPAQQRDQPDQVDAALQFGSEMLKKNMSPRRLARLGAIRSRRSTAARKMSPGRPARLRRWPG